MSAVERRSDDMALLAMAAHLEPGLRCRLEELLAAEGRAVTIDDLERRTQRAEDLANECRRQLHSLMRQNDSLRAAQKAATA